MFVIKPSLFFFKNLVFKCHVSVVYAKCSRAELITDQSFLFENQYRLLGGNSKEKKNTC